ncbi:hypothetical protein [Nocardiopsis sp. SBT366]|uniref:hypothetical protein n=1 Tax=Nocardiopsis sp. SBT366 TaxID=1580529 RepID=UPI00066BDB26|nr:hypothetical protein [Nocardiopsis sp. SBT366]
MRLSAVFLVGSILSLATAFFLGFWGPPFVVVHIVGCVLGAMCVFLVRMAFLVSPAEDERERREAGDLHRLLFGIGSHLLCGPLLLVTVATIVWRGSWEVFYLLAFTVPLYALAIVCQVRESGETPPAGPGPMIVGWGAQVTPAPGWAVLYLSVPLQRPGGLNTLNPRFQVDGENVVSLAAGQWATVVVAPGRRRVRALLDLQRSAPLEVDLRPGEEAHVELRYWPNPLTSGGRRTLDLHRVGARDPRPSTRPA